MKMRLPEIDPFLIAISGPSGVGKTSLSLKMISRFNDLSFSISTTTRLPRENEENGVDYNFISNEEFEKRISEKQFIEYVKSFGDRYYGTEISQIKKVKLQGKSVIFDIDSKGVIQIAEAIKDINFLKIFILPPSYDELKRRLLSRGNQPSLLIDERLSRFKDELEYLSIYDYILVNNDFDECLDNLSLIYKSYKLTILSNKIKENTNFII